MSEFHTCMRSMGYSEDLVNMLSENFTDPSEAIDFLSSRRFIVEGLLGMNIGEDLSVMLSVKHPTLESAVNELFSTIQPIRPARPPKPKEDVNEPPYIILPPPPPIYNLFHQPALIVPNAPNYADTRSIYIGSNSAKFDGKEIIHADRDRGVELMMDMFGQKPLSESSRSKLRQKYADGSELNNICVICQDQFINGVLITILPCDHYFHEACITKYFQSNRKCPTDNLEF